MMRFAFNLPMTSDHGLVGNIPSRQWDLSFLESDSLSGVDSPPQSAPWSGRKTSCDATVGRVWTRPNPDEASSARRRHSFIPPSSPNSAETNSGAKSFRLDSVAILSDPSVTGSGIDSPLPASDPQQHIYQNDVTASTEIVVVDRMSRVKLEENSRFFFPVINSPRLPNATNSRSSIPWLMVTSSGSEADTGSRSQSISSQDSSDLDSLGFRIRDDSGIGMTMGGEGVPRRNSSAPALNDLNIVVCRPSPSPLIECPNELVTMTPTDAAKGVDNCCTDEFSASGTDCMHANNAPDDDAYMKIARFLPSWDLERLSSVFHRLSICRFYLGKLSFDEAKYLLKGYPIGTFLLRDSSDNRFLFSLSVQTNRGTTSIRVVYEAGHFRLDCELEQVHLMPTFDCIVRLIQHYIRLASVYSRRGMRNNFVFLESSGRRDTPVLLRMPYANRPAALRHLCRLKINCIVGNQSVDRLQLIPSLKTFLKDYPYNI